MLWNWNVVDSCFLASSWHIKSNAMFAASCIGVAFLVVCLEFLRRVGKEYDAYILRQFQRQLRLQQAQISKKSRSYGDRPVAVSGLQFANFRATALQQLVRAVIHGATLCVAYTIMLLIMYYNGYIFISIILGAIVGRFLCDWMVVWIPYGGERSTDDRRTYIATAGPTGCCA
jgi:copper transporter 1